MVTDILLITPPFTQLNTCYPATPFLKGFLVQEGFFVKQVDLSIETFIHIFSRDGLNTMFNAIPAVTYKMPPQYAKMLKQRELYCTLIEPVVAFLQGNNEAYKSLICNDILPQGERYKIARVNNQINEVEDDIKAKLLATLFIEDIGDFITALIDEDFSFTKYASQIGISPRDFSIIEDSIKYDTILTQMMYTLFVNVVKIYNPKTIAFTIPFPGNLVAALKLSNYCKNNFPEIPIVIGGGWVNTELRDLTETKVFKYVDYICFDNGERPLSQLLNYLLKGDTKDNLVRTLCLENNNIKYYSNSTICDIDPSNTGTPNYSDLQLTNYISFVEMLNPMHSLWSNGRWNKLMIAQGCYWHQCAFCDTSLDYIANYKSIQTQVLCDRIEDVIKQTNYTGFHFIDEAAPPKALKELALEIIKRNIKITWWTNIRFESNFTSELCQLLAQSGCIAVSGGLEVLSDRLLVKMNKGVTINQAASVCGNFQQAGIMVHAYLMYGFPTQTEQETIDSLEVVRQFFKNKLIQSAFWHKFVMTVHSPIGKAPEQYHVEAIHKTKGMFANNDYPHIDKTGCNHCKFSSGLEKALYNYMHNNGIDLPLQTWFDFKVNKPAVAILSL